MRSIRLTAPLLASLLALTACNKAQEKPDVAKLPHYDLTPASNARFLVDYAAKPGVFKTQDGLEYRIIKSGAGKAPQSGADMVTVKYRGSLIDGKVFDETRGQTATFPAGGLIPGWVEALALMKEGDEWELVIPSNLGYGPQGAGDGAIPGGQTLIFDMTLVSVAPAQ